MGSGSSSIRRFCITAPRVLHTTVDQRGAGQGRGRGTVVLSFRGAFNQKVDAKGRMSIPADFRRVLEQGDPRYPENPLPRLVVLHGPHLKQSLHVYTISAMAEIERDIQKLPRGSLKRKQAARMILGHSWETEVDKEGRIVLPQRLRQKIGLDGEAQFLALGDYFEIWNAATYDEVDGAETAAFLDTMPDDFDPLSLLEPQAE